MRPKTNSRKRLLLRCSQPAWQKAQTARMLTRPCQHMRPKTNSRKRLLLMCSQPAWQKAQRNACSCSSHPGCSHTDLAASGGTDPVQRQHLQGMAFSPDAPGASRPQGSSHCSLDCVSIQAHGIQRHDLGKNILVHSEQSLEAKTPELRLYMPGRKHFTACQHSCG